MHGNYGLYFTWLDRLMSTQHPDYVATFEATASRPVADGHTAEA